MRHLVCAAFALVLSAAAAAQGPEKAIAPPASLTAEGIPSIPQSIADGLAKYAQFRDARLVGWNPARRQIVISTTLGSIPQLYSVDGPGRDRRQITWYEPRGVSASAAASFDPADANTMIFQFDPE